MSTWWKASKYDWDDNGITEVEVEKETARFVFVKDGFSMDRRAQVGNDECYFNNREAAVKWRRDYLQRSVESYAYSLRSAKQELQKFNEAQEVTK